MKFPSLVLAGVLAASAAQAATFTTTTCRWAESLPNPTSLTLNDVIEHERMLVATGNHGVALLSNDGVRWWVNSYQPGLRINALAIHEGEIHGVGHNALYRLQPEGWNRIAALDEGIELFALASAGNEVIVAGGRPVAYESYEPAIAIVGPKGVRLLEPPPGDPAITSVLHVDGRIRIATSRGRVLSRVMDQWVLEVDANVPLNSLLQASHRFYAAGGELETPSFCCHPNASVSILASFNEGDWQEVFGDQVYYPGGLHDLAVLGGGLVAVGGAGQVVRSSDGISWVREQAYGETLLGVAGFGEHVVAVGENGRIATIGESMVVGHTRRLGAEEIHAVGYGDGQFVAVGNQDSWAGHSRNGFDWREIDIGITEPRAVIYGDGRFVVAGDGGVAVSSDPTVSWSTVEIPFQFSVQLADAAFDGTYYYAVGDRHIASSTDTAGWEVNRGRSSSEGFPRIAAGDGDILTVAYDAHSFALSSDRGKTWQEHELLPRASGVVWDGTRFLGLKSRDGRGIISADGTSWHEIPMSLETSIADVVKGPDLLVTVGVGGDIATSTDGSEWTVRNSGVPSTLTDINWNGEKYLAVGYDGTVIVSLDGIDWERIPPFTDAPLLGVEWSGTSYAAHTQEELWTSPDGRTWTPAYLGDLTTDSLFLRHLEFGNNRWVLAGARRPEGQTQSVSAVVTGTVGGDWALSSIADTVEVGFLLWTGEVFSATASGGLYTSTDGTTWQYDHEDDLAGIRWVAAGPAGFVTPSAGLFSVDGINWVRTGGSATARRLLDAVWDGERFVMVGSTREHMGTGKIYVTRDGYDVSEIAVSLPPLQGIENRDGQYLVTTGQGQVYVSSDLQTWTALEPAPIDDRTVGRFAVSEDRIVLGDVGGALAVLDCGRIFTAGFE